MAVLVQVDDDAGVASRASVRMHGGSIETASERTVASSSRPVCIRIARRAASAARAEELSATRASATKARPAGVRRTGPGGRSTSGPPSSTSSAWICWDSDGCETWSRCAARVNERVSAIASTYSIWRSVIGTAYWIDARIHLPRPRLTPTSVG